MSHRLLYSPLAQEDMEAIWLDAAWDAQAGESADRYIRGLREQLTTRQGYPKAGLPIRFRGEFTGVYAVIYKNCAALYRLRGDDIEVGRVLPANCEYMQVILKSTQAAGGEEEAQEQQAASPAGTHRTRAV